MGTCSVCVYACARIHTHIMHTYTLSQISQRTGFTSETGADVKKASGVWSILGRSMISDIATDDPFHQQGSRREQTVLKHPCLPTDLPYYPRNPPVSTDCLQNRTPSKGKRTTLGVSSLLHSAAVCTGFCPFLKHLSSYLPGSSWSRVKCYTLKETTPFLFPGQRQAGPCL